jgi:hypothetical protein
VTAGPFGALGLPARPDLTDEQVRAAWRRVSRATHPDRSDGGDTARYSAAVAAYAQLRTPWGRTEAYADLTAPQALTPPPGDDHQDQDQDQDQGRPPGARAAALITAARWLPARIRHGRPARLAARAAAAVILSLITVRIIPGQPAAPAVITGLITWFTLTARTDLAPLPGR